MGSFNDRSSQYLLIGGRGKISLSRRSTIGIQRCVECIFLVANERCGAKKDVFYKLSSACRDAPRLNVLHRSSETKRKHTCCTTTTAVSRASLPCSPSNDEGWGVATVAVTQQTQKQTHTSTSTPILLNSRERRDAKDAFLFQRKRIQCLGGVRAVRNRNMLSHHHTEKPAPHPIVLAFLTLR